MIVDIAVGVILLLSLIIGAKRGLIRSLLGIAALVLALWGASWCTEHLTEPLLDQIEPLVAERVQQQMLENSGADRSSGLLKDLAERVSGSAADWMSSAVREVLLPVLRTVIYVVAFLLLNLLLRLLGGVLKLAENLPVIHSCNALGGAVLGLISGIVILFVALYAAEQFGWLRQELLEESRLAPFLMAEEIRELMGSL